MSHDKTSSKPQSEAPWNKPEFIAQDRAEALQRNAQRAAQAKETEQEAQTTRRAERRAFGKGVAAGLGAVAVSAIAVVSGNWLANQAVHSIESDTYRPTAEQQEVMLKGVDGQGNNPGEQPTQTITTTLPQ